VTNRAEGEFGEAKVRKVGTEVRRKKIMKFKFENLIIWQKAMDYGENIYQLSSQFPKEEIYNLTSQIRRAVDSIALNISEGSIGQSSLEQKRFIGMATRSLAEVVTCLHKASRRKYISEAEFNEHYDFAYNLMNMMVAFKKKIE
jgi:four helix bundle protein